jgi:hypothetical protein
MKLCARLSLGLTVPQWEWLRGEAARLGVGIAELLRRKIDEWRGA